MRNAKMFFFVLAVLASVPVLSVCAITGLPESEPKKDSMQLTIQAGNKTFTAVLYDNESSAAFVR
ncbi:MAG: hypothetical protein ACRCUT_01515, partial [Spirochaetota bacterium]